MLPGFFFPPAIGFAPRRRRRPSRYFSFISRSSRGRPRSPICLAIYLSFYFSIYFYLAIYLSIYFSIFLSIYFFYLSILLIISTRPAPITIISCLEQLVSGLVRTEPLIASPAAFYQLCVTRPIPMIARRPTPVTRRSKWSRDQ